MQYGHCHEMKISLCPRLVIGLIFLGASSLYAQDTELTLEEVALQAATLAERVTEVFAGQVKLADRVAAVETAIAPTPTPTPTAGPAVPRLNIEEMKEDYFDKIFAAAKKYGEFDGGDR